MNIQVTEDKPIILKAIELVLAKPDAIKKQTISLIEKFKSTHKTKSEQELRKIIGNKIISNYSYYAGFAGGTTSLVGVIPGLGTVASVSGGATTDAALCMKYQIEMVMSLATLYGHDISLEEEKNLCMVIAGVGALAEFGKKGGSQIGSKAFKNLIEEYLKGSVLLSIKKIFKMIGITFTKKALQKVIPFGVGVLIGFSANKISSRYIGKKAIDFFECE